MPQTVKASPRSLGKLSQWGLRLLGVVLLAFLLTRVDLQQIFRTYQQSDKWLILLVICGLLPVFFLKTLRWLAMLRAQHLHMRIMPAFAAYLGSFFVGVLTPGRLGEFIKAMYVSRECNVSVAHGLSSVLADRLFDLCILMMVGSVAIFQLSPSINVAVAFGVAVLLLTVSLVAILNDHSFSFVKAVGLKLGWAGQKMFGTRGLLVDLREGLRQFTPGSIIAGAALTVLAYAAYFGQCYLLTRALRMNISYSSAAFAVSIGGLITLLPVSISGVGTRDAAIVFYLKQYAVSTETALSYSLLFFFVFYLVNGLIGAVAWWGYPIPLSSAQEELP